MMIPQEVKFVNDRLEYAIYDVKRDYRKNDQPISDDQAEQIARHRLHIKWWLRDYEGPVLSGQVNIQDA